MCKMLICNTLCSTAKKPQSPIIYAAWSTACFGRYIPGRIGCHRQLVRVLVNSCPSSRSKWHCELPFRYRLSLFGLFQAQGVIKSTLKYFDNRSLYSDLQRSLHSAGHRSLQWQASCSKQAAQAKPKGLLRLLCAGDAENVNQPGFPLSPKIRSL